MRLNIRFQEQNESFSGLQESDETIRFGFGEVNTITENDYERLVNKPQINSIELSGNLSARDLGLGKVYYDTKENWDIQRSLIAEEAAIYIYSNYEYEEDEVGNRIPVAGLKIGDGTSYLIDMPFVSGATTKAVIEHLANTAIHVTAAEKEFWNNKVSSYMGSGASGETLVLSKTAYEKNGEIISG